MEFINKIVGYINDALYSYILIIILVLGGLYFTFRTKAVQFRKLKEQIKSVGEKTDGKGVSSFQALMVSTASRVGTGNIIGVSTALCLGGFGSVFWMWVIALIGAGSAFVESTLAQIFKKRGPEGSFGGPAYYIEAAFKKRWLGGIFAVLSAGLLWNVADVLMGLMAVINVPVIIILGKYAFRALRDYEKQRKEGKDPEFKAKDIGLPYNTDYWN